MLKVIIIEDEELIRKKLRYFPDYKSLGMNVVAEGKNGKEGVDLIKEIKPEIVITDINMPIKNGLDMIHETMDYDYSAIIISGYNEFEFAKKALKYGVTDYILKPLNIDELTFALKNAKKIFEMRKHYENNKCEIDILETNFNDDRKNKLVEQMIVYIENNYQLKISISDLEKKLNYSESLLNKRFKDYTKMTFNEYLNRYRIKKSIEYMKTKKLDLIDVAFLCGFSDSKYFSKVFKKYIGMSPSEFGKHL